MANPVSVSTLEGVPTLSGNKIADKAALMAALEKIGAEQSANELAYKALMTRTKNKPTSTQIQAFEKKDSEIQDRTKAIHKLLDKLRDQ